MNKKVGCVAEEERDEIQKLFERRNGLVELAKIVTPVQTDLYERMVADLGETSTKFDKWWRDMASKYDWEGNEDASWEIDFETCEIYLVKAE